ncbi:hypothetical protein [Streptomyces virginiae]|uniref:hypothetical protein n=1 Tax=Streptomyces virginiae TaxID=1961 RepID=UPI0004C91C67|nr:hypothetical protein [Streptomyces virginiae]
MEINALAELLHEYAGTAGLSIKAVHEAVTPEMLPAGTPAPDRRRMHDVMDGRDLTRAIAHAVIDVCSGLEGDPRLDEVRPQAVDALFERAETAPTPVRAGVPMCGELVEAKDRLLVLHSDLDNARQALQETGNTTPPQTCLLPARPPPDPRTAPQGGGIRPMRRSGLLAAAAIAGVAELEPGLGP